MSALRRPSLLRSLSFWSGVVLIGCILWAWWDSSWRWVYQSAGPFVFASKDSGLAIFHDPRARNGWRINGADTSAPHRYGSTTARPRLARPGLATAPAGALGLAEYAQLKERREFAGKRLDPVVADYYFYFQPAGYGPRSWFLFIPYWCVLCAGLALWLALIYGMHRRIARHLSTATTEASTPAE